MNQDEMAAALRRAGAELRRIEPTERIEAKLVAAFCVQTGAPPVRRLNVWCQPVLAWAAVATAVLGVALWLSPAHRPGIPNSPAEAAEDGQVTEPYLVSGVQWPANLDSDAAVEIAGDEFIALPNVDQAAPSSAMNLVRVELARSAMKTLGLTVAADRTSESVLADVVLDADGLARAIRFVNLH